MPTQAWPAYSSYSGIIPLAAPKQARPAYFSQSGVIPLVAKTKQDLLNPHTLVSFHSSHPSKQTCPLLPLWYHSTRRTQPSKTCLLLTLWYHSTRRTQSRKTCSLLPLCLARLASSRWDEGSYPRYWCFALKMLEVIFVDLVDHTLCSTKWPAQD